MKTRKTVLCVVLTLGVLLFLSSCETTKTPLSTENIDELLGTWANPENNYDKTGYNFGKMVFKPDKTADFYTDADSKKPGYSASLDVKEKWMDRKGACYFKTFLVFVEVQPYEPYGLFKVNSDGNSLEMMFSLAVREEEGLTSEIDPTAGPIEDPTYFIWYRQ